MKRLTICSLLFVSLFFLLHPVPGALVAYAGSDPAAADGTCKDGIDNSIGLDANADGVVDKNEQVGDGKADYYGVDTDGDGKLDLEPDPSCVSPEGTERVDISNSNLISCYNFCTFSDLLKTINNFITFLITKLFIPTIVIVFLYAGFKYLTAQGNPKKIANLKQVLGNIIIGILLILCSWLIVKVILSALVSDSQGALQFFDK